MRLPRLAACFCVAACLSVVAPAAHAETVAPAPRLTIGLLGVSTSGTFRPEELSTVEDVLLTALDTKGHFKVVGRADLPDLDARRQRAGCSDDRCLAQIAGAAGMDLLATVHLGRLGELTVVTVNAVSTRTGEAVARSHQAVKQDSELLAAADVIAIELAAAVAQVASLVPGGPAAAASNPAPAAASVVAPTPSTVASAGASAPAAPVTAAAPPAAATAPPAPAPPAAPATTETAQAAAPPSATALDLSARPPAKSVVPPPAPMTLKRKVGIGIIVGGGAVFLAGCLVGVEVSSATSNLEGSIHPVNTATSMANSINTLVNVANALFGIGGALAATGVAVAF